MTDQEEAWARRLVGRELNGRYRLTQLLGMGGMGAVFAAEHMAVGRRVAVKLLLPDLAADQTTVRRFHQEARSAAAVARRGVVDILDYDVDEVSGPYLVMEMLDGEPLSRRIERLAKLEPGDTMWIARSILRTLAAVHAQGIVHRDLKPDNVYIAREEQEEVVKILDFGISRIMTQDPKQDSALLTRPGVVLGTPTYMAPEQARGETDVDHRVDIYAVGAILFECCAGRPPHVGGTWQQVFAAVLTSPPPPLRSLRPGLPAPMYDAIDRALSRDRDARFPDAESMLAALTGITEPLPRTRAPAGAGAEVPMTRVGPATPVGDAWAPAKQGTPYAVSTDAKPKPAKSRGGCLIAAGLAAALLFSTVAVGVGFYFLRSANEGEGEGETRYGGTDFVAVGSDTVTVSDTEPDTETETDTETATDTETGTEAGSDTGTDTDTDSPSDAPTKVADRGSAPTRRGGPTRAGSSPSAGGSDATDTAATDTTAADTTAGGGSAGTAPALGAGTNTPEVSGNVAATLRARLDAANAHRRAGRVRQAIDGYEDVIHMTWTGQIPAGSAASRPAAEARIALGDIYSARIRALERAATPDEFSEGFRRVTSVYSQAAQEYGRVGMYGHTDLTICGLVRTGRAGERLADVTKNIQAPQSLVDLGGEHAENFESSFRDNARSYLESARGVYEAAISIQGASPCRAEAMDSMQRVLRALGRRNP